MANKALVIDVKEGSRLNGVLEKWETIGKMEGFTRDIETPKLDDNADKSAIVSGIPTVFARANMFSLALSYSGDSMSNAASAGMIEYYNDLVDEWFGLITCIALNGTLLQIKRIELDYSDGKGLTETGNIYEAKGAFGNMLFERKPLWCEQTKDNGIKKPFINVIKYNNQVVGGTSPECLLFTAPSYSINPEPRYAPEGKFRDPVKHGNLSGKDWLALYAYVKNLIDNLTGDFTAYYQNLDEALRPGYGLITRRLQMWLEDIRRNIEDDVEKAAANPVTGFTSPFSIIFNYSDEMYGSNGSINSRYVSGYTAFKAEDLLLPRNSEIARIQIEEKYYSKLPIQLLVAREKGSEKHAYFALPLSVTGLKIFGSSISALVGKDNNGILSKMTAEFDSMAKDNNLTVYLTLNTEDGKTKNIVTQYTVKNDRIIRDVDVLLWPNFISEQWNKYFLYSELPHGVTSINFNVVPFVGEQRDGKFLPISDANGTPVYLTNTEKLKDYSIDSKLLVTADHRVAEHPYKYEIYQSNKPFAGLKLTCGIDKDGNEKVSGFLLIRYSSTAKNMMNDTTITFRTVSLGFDFGSTNSSVAYYDSTNDDHPKTKGDGLYFQNRRISLFGSDYIEKEKDQPRDFFFFPKKEIRSNALKSMLTLHDKSRIPTAGSVSYSELPVAGGIPCFMNNLPINTVTPNSINLVFDNAEATLINNMKWSNSESEKNYKKAYLRTVLLMVYAELFDRGLRPDVLNWSYPSTMELSMVNTYNGIWKSLGEPSMMPILKEKSGSAYELKVRAISDQKIVTDKMDQGPVLGKSSSDSIGSDMFSSNEFDSSSSSQSSIVNPERSFGRFGKKVQEQVAVQQLDLNPKDVQKTGLEFNRINTSSPMTEACASANYSAQTFDISRKIVYCFDVGGSTTDISALYKLRDNTMRDAVPFMIKQNSIRFAAQRVSSATRVLHEEFKQVLTQVCNRFHIDLIGFNCGESRYSASTAPYYYEQIVDRLNSEQLPFFYERVAEYCPRLFAVNMYVTGLIMFYAGQLASPLDEAINAFMTRNCPELPPPEGFQPVFEGKGARIFDWLSTMNYPMAAAYYKAMFTAGAQMPEMDPECIDLDSLQNGRPNEDVKFEVSKGLASPNGELQEPIESFEIFGENGFVGHDTQGNHYKYDFTTMITPEWMKEIGGSIRQDHPDCACFKKFLSIYYNAVQRILTISMDKEECNRGLSNMNIEQYVTQELPRYREAMERYRNNKPFDYVAPIIIIEGLKFYEKHLLKCFK